MGQTRGRRRDKKEKKKIEQEQDDLELAFEEVNNTSSQGDWEGSFGTAPADQTSSGQSRQAAFFGLLDRQELEYFKSAESTLAANALTADEKVAFVENVFEESKGKELKLVTNQVCSKLFERLVMLANDDQLIYLLKSISGHVFVLSLQKYSSHCVETLLWKSAGLVEREVRKEANYTMSDEIVSAEMLIVFLVNELRPHVSEMAKEKYSSHVLRLILLLLAGLSLGNDPALRSKKSRKAREYTDMDAVGDLDQRQVPSTFTEASNEILTDLTQGLDSSKARNLAIDPLTSPLYQVVVRIQSSRSYFTFVDLCLTGEGSEAFYQHTTSDAVGTHFLQSCLMSLPRKKLLNIYQTRFKGNLVKMACSDNGNFVVQSLLKSKLGPKNEVVAELLSETPKILAENQVQVVRTMLQAGEPAQKAEIYKLIIQRYGSVAELLLSNDLQKALLLQDLVTQPQYLQEAGKALTYEIITSKATDPVQSHVLEAILRPEMEIVERRRILNIVVPLVADLAANAYGSHLVDKLWPFCFKLKFVRERIATELSKHEETLKKSNYGKMVWKNWKLDKYLHSRKEWYNIVKEHEDSLRETVNEPPAPRANGKAKPRPRINHKKPYDRPETKAN
ncbi:Nucleolar protein 9 [Wickerhamiella sorbophila]|uniref:Nucleolar protein 9 n=1 Tax=Wickerhamiella sorbophila TaxID=45607 RepID=A0A2T0FLT9_9ASCO|nr:Nucleolar protein 9 [Wickerhamiella sorbophila]PRT55963.1 Nucleolar protein 9 [Wickerhamiella sorbophila]